MKFTDAHASSAVCTPSRYSILTGRYNWRSALKYSVLFGYSPSLIEKDRMTVASMLKKYDYRTACIGKWHLGLDWEKYDGSKVSLHEEDTDGIDFSAPIKNGPNEFGFDYYYGISASLDMPPYVYIENDRVTQLPDHVTGCNDSKMFWRKGPTATDFKHIEVLPMLTQKALEKIEEFKDDSFFLYFPIPAPHTPILPTEEFQGKSGTNSYGDFVLMCDDVVGKVMDKLDELGIADNTILIYASDNGCSPCADFDELLEAGHNPSYIFRGHKADIYEGGHRIPLLIRWPEAIKPDSVSAQTVCLCDLMATAADIVGYKLPDNAGEDSISNLPLWLGEDEKIRKATVHHSIDGSFSIRKDNWKLEMCAGSGGWSYPKPEETEGMPEIQLYNLDDDIGERENVYDKHLEVVNELQSLLEKYILDGRSTPGDKQDNTGGKYWDQLHWMKNN
jgi:arylsulfatase A-like enzyme